MTTLIIEQIRDALEKTIARERAAATWLMDGTVIGRDLSAVMSRSADDHARLLVDIEKAVAESRSMFDTLTALQEQQ